MVDENQKILETAILSGDAERCERILAGLNDQQGVLSRLEADDLGRLLTTVSIDTATSWMQRLPDVLIMEALAIQPPESVAAIVSELPEDQRNDILAEMSDEDAERVLSLFSLGEAKAARDVLEADEDTIASIASKEYVAFFEQNSVEDVLASLKSQSEELRDYEVQYLYAVDRCSKVNSGMGPPAWSGEQTISF